MFSTFHSPSIENSSPEWAPHTPDICFFYSELSFKLSFCKCKLTSCYRWKIHAQEWFAYIFCNPFIHTHKSHSTHTCQHNSDTEPSQHGKSGNVHSILVSLQWEYKACFDSNLVSHSRRSKFSETSHAAKGSHVSKYCIFMAFFSQCWADTWNHPHSISLGISGAGVTLSVPLQQFNTKWAS